MSYFSLLIAVFISSAAIAAVDFPTDEKPTSLTTEITDDALPQKEDRWRLGLGLGLGYSNLSGFYFSGSLTPEKFITKNFSLGGHLGYSNPTFTGYERYQLGPSATYQFWANKYLRAYGNQKFMANYYKGSKVKDDNTDYISWSELGLGWFILDAFLYHRELMDKSDFIESSNGAGLRLVFMF